MAKGPEARAKEAKARANGRARVKMENI